MELKSIFYFKEIDTFSPRHILFIKKTQANMRDFAPDCIRKCFHWYAELFSVLNVIDNLLIDSDNRIFKVCFYVI